MNNQIQPPPPPLYPETFTIECNRGVIKEEYPDLNPYNYEFTTKLTPPLEIKEGDEIELTNAFVNEIGADEDIIIFNNDASTNLKDTSCRIVYNFYGIDDGSNLKRRSIDIAGHSTSDNFEYNTFNPMLLYRYQPNAFFIQPSDSTTEPYKTLFKDYLKYNNSYDQKVWFPEEDRYLPGRFFSSLSINQTEVDSTGGNKFEITLDSSTGLIDLKNAGSDSADKKITNFIQKGQIICLETNRDQIATANSKHMYLDGYYTVIDSNNTNNSEGISLYPFDERIGSQNTVYEQNTWENNCSGTTITMRPNEYTEKGRITDGIYVSTGGLIGANYIRDNTTITNVTDSTVIDTNETVAYGSGTSGQNELRIRDTSNIELYEKLKVGTSYLPIASKITSVVADTSPDRTVGGIDETQPTGSTVIRVQRLDDKTTASLVDALYYGIDDDGQTQPYYVSEDVSTGETTFHVDAYDRRLSDYYQVVYNSSFGNPKKTIRLRKTQWLDLDDTKFLLMGTAGNYELNGISTITNDTFGTTSFEYDVLTDNSYPNGYTGWIPIDDNVSKPLSDDSLLNMKISIGNVGSVNPVFVSDMRQDPIFNEWEIKLSVPLNQPIGNDSNIYGSIESFRGSDGAYHDMMEDSTHLNIKALYGRIDFFYPGAELLSAGLTSGVLQANTKIVSVTQPPGYTVPGFYLLEIDKPVSVNFPQEGIDDIDVVFTSTFTVVQQYANTFTVELDDAIDGYEDQFEIGKYVSFTSESNQSFIDTADYIYNSHPIKAEMNITYSNVNGAFDSDTTINNVVLYQPFDSATGYEFNYFQITINPATEGDLSTGDIIRVKFLNIDADTLIEAITYVPNGDYCEITLSKPLIAPWDVNGQAEITKQYPNQGSIFWDTNLTANAPLNDVFTLETVHVDITLSQAMVGTLPGDTELFFSCISIDDFDALPFDIKLKPKGYSYVKSTDLNIGEFDFIGMALDDKINIGDELYQYQFARINDSSPQTDNVGVIITNDEVDVVSCKVTEIVDRITVGNYNNNSVLTGTLRVEYGNQDLIPPSDTRPLRFNNKFTMTFDDNIQGAGLLTNTSKIFNISRGVTIKLYGSRDGIDYVEYCRIPQGVNDTHITDATAIWLGGKFIVDGVLRGVLTDTIYNFFYVYGDGVLDFKFECYDENVFNEDFKIEIDNHIHEQASNGFDGFFNDEAPFGESYFLSKSASKDILNRSSNRTSVGDETTQPLFNLPHDYIYSCSNMSTTKAWVEHLEYIDIDLGDKIHLSPSDIGSIITEEFHKTKNAKISMDGFNQINIGNNNSINRLGGLDLPNSKNYIPHNRTYIPIWTTPVDEDNTKKSGVSYWSWFTGGASSATRTEPYEYSFKFQLKYSNYKRTTATDTTFTDDDGNTYNHPIAAGTVVNDTWDVYTRGGKIKVIDGVSGGALTSDVYPFNLVQGFNGTTFHHGNTPKVQVLYSQMIGSNNITCDFNSNTNRIELLFLHSPYTSPVYEDAGNVIGGDISAFIPYPSLEGSDGMNPCQAPYHGSVGGINIVNYCAEKITRGQYSYLTAVNNFNGNQTSKAYDMLNPFYDTTKIDKTNMDLEAIRFWTKLGWTTSQLASEIGSTINSDTGFLQLNGTTNAPIDCSSNLIYKQISAQDTGDPLQGTINGQSGYAYGSVGGLEYGIDGKAPTGTGTDAKKGTQFYKATNNSITANSLPNTTGHPLLKYDPTAHSDPNGRIIYNMDNQKQPGYLVEIDGSTALSASNLPKKTSNPYFLLYCPEFANLNNFYTTSNKGDRDLECIGIISKLNVAQDFYYNYQNPSLFFAKNDFLLSKITSRILLPNKQIPTTLGENSSVIYTITRNSPQPVTIDPPIQEFQADMFNTMIQTDIPNQLQVSKNPQIQMEFLVGQIANAVLTPDDNSSVILANILNLAKTLDIFKMSKSKLKEFILTHPDAGQLMEYIMEYQNYQSNVPMAQPTSFNPLENELMMGVPLPPQEDFAIDDILNETMGVDETLESSNNIITDSAIETNFDQLQDLNEQIFEETLNKMV